MQLSTHFSTFLKRLSEETEDESSFLVSSFQIVYCDCLVGLSAHREHRRHCGRWDDCNVEFDLFRHADTCQFTQASEPSLFSYRHATCFLVRAFIFSSRLGVVVFTGGVVGEFVPHWQKQVNGGELSMSRRFIGNHRSSATPVARRKGSGDDS